MNILSLFDWISCGRVALERAWIKVDRYFASEIDKYAIQIAKKNYPDTIHIGSVTDVKYGYPPLNGWQPLWTNYPWKLIWWEKEEKVDIDMIIWWSPCQDLSIAKKDGKWLQWEKSWLFFEYVRLLKEVKPKYFLLENVASMKKADKEEITRILTEIYPDTQCYLINSALVSAQNRKRLYWTNIQWVEQPEDKGIILQDILQDGAEVDERMIVNGKSYSLTASYNWAVEWNSVAKKQRTMVRAAWVALRNRWEWKKPEFNGTEKANSMTTVQTDSMVSIPPIIRKLTPECFDLQAIKNILQLYLLTTIYATDNEANTNSILSLLSEPSNSQEISELKIWGIISFYKTKILQSDMYGDCIWWKEINIQWLVNDPLPRTKTNGGRNDVWIMWERQCERCSSYWWRPHQQSEDEFTETMQKLPQFTTQKIKTMQDMWKKAEMTRILREALPEIQEILKPKYDSMVTTPIIRKLTCVEAERLQTLPDNYTEGISNTQRYKAIWNWWTVDVIAHIFSYIK